MRSDERHHESTMPEEARRPPDPRLVPLLRIFLSSPGDVADERNLALAAVERVQYDPFLRGKVALETVAWDRPAGAPPLLATATPQASVDSGMPKPSECDIVAVVLWSRLGTPLPYPEYATTDGRPYASGTEWEFEDAMRAATEQGRPAVLLYRRASQRSVDPNDPNVDELVRQWRLVDEFFGRLIDPSSGALRGGYKLYESPTEFRDVFERDLKALVRQRLELLSEVPPEWVSTPAAPLWEGSPFPGLRAFTPADAPVYFGRGRETDALVARVVDSPFTAVVGASGSGKSSLVGAGLIPRLASGAFADVPDWLLPSFDRETGQWAGLRFSPGELGSDPFIPFALRLAPLVGGAVRKVAAALAGAPDDAACVVGRALDTNPEKARALVVVDQFEELFTLVDPSAVGHFVQLLESLAAAPNVHTVVTMRSDYYDRCLELPALARLLERGQFPLAAPDETLFEMVARPAERAGLAFAEGLADRIVIDAGREPGALPLLAYALDELYRRRDGQTLGFAAYERLGGVHGAIGKRAEAVFAALDEATQATFSAVFRELVEIDERGQVARRRAPVKSFERDERARLLLDRFTEARLLVQSAERAGAPVVYVAHEALFARWGRLREWLTLHEEDLRQVQKAEAAAQEWVDQGRADSYLWTHERQEPVYEALTRLGKTLDDETQLFLRPEHERQLVALGAETEPYRRRVIVDRLVAIGDPAIPGLGEALRRSAAERDEAASGLARIGAPAVPVLLEAIEDDDPEVRLAAAAALRQVRDERAVPFLVRALDDGDARVRGVAVGALQAFPTTDAAEAIAERLADTEVDVRWRAAGLLGAFGAGAIVPLLASLGDSDQRVREAARGAVAAIGARGVDDALQALHDADGGGRARAAEALIVIGQPAVRGLVELLANDDVDLRWRSVAALGAIADRSSTPAVVGALTDEDRAVRLAAAETLRLLADALATEALVATLADPDVEFAEAAAAALVAVGAPATDRLIERLRSPSDGPAQALAARALGAIGEPAVIALAAVLESDDERTRQRAIEALERCGPAATGELVEALRRGPALARTAAAETLRALGEAAVPAVVELADEPDPAVRRNVPAALHGSTSTRAASALIALLADDDEATRETAAVSLAALGEAALPPLFDALQSGDAGRASAAAYGLTLAGGTGVPGLLRIAGESEGALRSRTIDVLEEIGTPAALFGLSELGLDRRGH